jgi:hypothetical protein
LGGSVLCFLGIWSFSIQKGLKNKELGVDALISGSLLFRCICDYCQTSALYRYSIQGLDI